MLVLGWDRMRQNLKLDIHIYSAKGRRGYISTWKTITCLYAVLTIVHGVIWLCFGSVGTARHHGRHQTKRGEVTVMHTVHKGL